MGWLVRDDKVLASLDVAADRATRRRGLLGRSSFDGAMLIEPARSVHTIGMRFALDIALLDADGTVLLVLTAKPWRLVRPRRGVASVLEAEAGAFDRWNLTVGDCLEFRR